MLERDVRRKYFRELGAAMLAYVAVLFGSITLAKSMDDGLPRTLLLIAPLIPVVLVVWVIARQFRRLDEFARLQSLESVAIAAAVTAGWTLTYGFLENAGFPRLSMFWVWPVMGIVWGVHACLRTVANR
ncbi:MAG: hypothetical protein ACREVZ_08310 [Burkholderiales bacterium]